MVGLLALGVGAILFYESRQPVTHTGPELTVLPSTDADLSLVQNDIQAVQAIANLQHPAVTGAS